MKKATALFLAAVSALLGGCYVTQEMQDDASFEGLKKVYIEDQTGASDVFSAGCDTSELNVSVKKAIADTLKAKGFTIVDKKADAQIVFRPLWNASVRQPDPFSDGNSINTSTVVLPVGSTIKSDMYATLEIQAILPDSGDIWSWRGFSPISMSASSYADGQIADQVEWCLQYFPPEKYPAKTEEVKAEKQQQKIKADENPYKQVLIKEREKQENEASQGAKVEKIQTPAQ